MDHRFHYRGRRNGFLFRSTGVLLIMFKTGTPLHQYQNGILISFVLSLAIFVVYIALSNGMITTTLEKTVGICWLVLYTSFCLWLRRRIPDRKRIGGLKRPIVHWVLLGISLIYFNIVRPSDFQFLYPIINIGFVLFALFSADAHWDFRK